MATQWQKKFNDMFSHFNTLPAFNRNMDGQMDILLLHSLRYAHALHSKNGIITPKRVRHVNN